MKKLILILPVIALLATGCKFNQNTNLAPRNNNQQNNQLATDKNNSDITQNLLYSDYDLKTNISGDLIYTDKNYSFQLTIPNENKYFAVEQRKYDSGEAENNILFTFYSDAGKTQFISGFEINIFPKAKGEELEKDNTRKISITAKNDQYAYQFNPDLASHDLSLIMSIIKTLKVNY